MTKNMKTTKEELLADERTCERLVTRDGFLEFYWETIRSWTAANETFTYKEVFRLLSSVRKKRWGECLFPSYEAFYMWQKRNRESS